MKNNARSLTKFINWYAKHRDADPQTLYSEIDKRVPENMIYDVQELIADRLDYEMSLSEIANEVLAILRRCVKYGYYPKEDIVFNDVDDFLYCYEGEDGWDREKTLKWLKEDKRFVIVGERIFQLES